MDTQGSDNTMTIMSSYFRRAHAYILMFDVTDRPSFDVAFSLPPFLSPSSLSLSVFFSCCTVVDRLSFRLWRTLLHVLLLLRESTTLT